jgi:two-component system chemotaxis response regulator CheY
MSTKILIVDDSIYLRQSVKFTLEQSGFYVSEAVDGAEGLKIASEIKHDLIISDVNMPNMDGLTMIKNIRSSTVNKFTPILVLTTESQGPILDEGRKAGASGWIVKPFDNEKLMSAINKFV